MASKISVFIGSSSEGSSIAKWLKNWLIDNAGDEISANLWSEGPFRLNEAYLESLTREARTSDFAILVATADDTATIRDKQILQARDNVMFELGLFMGKLGRARTCLVCSDQEDLRLPSDLSGISVLKFNQDQFDSSNFDNLREVGQKLLHAIRICSDEDGGFFVLFPSLRNEPFYLDLMAGITASSSGTRDVTFLMPSKAYSGPQFLAKLDELAAKQRGFKGGLIAATLSGMETDDLRDKIALFRIPIVLVDVDPYHGLDLPKNVCYIGVDNRAGGRLAAKFMRESLAGVAKPPRVLVLANNDQAERHEGFLEELAGTFDTHLELCGFLAEDGRRAVAKVFKSHAGSARAFDGIFAVSDELALGAIDALSNLSDPAGGAAKTVVVGFDGSPMAKILIDNNLTPLKNTIVQDAYELGERGMSMLREIVGPPVAMGKRRRMLPVSIHLK